MSLPNYPLPELDDTVEEVSRVLKLILNREEFEQYQSVLHEEKEQLRRQCEAFKKKNKEKDNWATENFQHQLLSLRVPLPISTCLAVLMRTSTKHTDQLAHVAAILWSVGRVKLNMSQLINQYQGGILEDRQQTDVFSTSRIPCRGTDNLVNYHESRHAVLLYKNSAFRVDILSSSDDLFPIQEIYNQIASIVKYNGVFHQEISNYTALERNMWSNIRSTLMEGDSQKSLEIMETAIVAIALDDCEELKGTQEIVDYIRLGSKGISCMRYYDKILNIVVFKNGKYGMLFEHSAVDGMLAGIVVKLLHNICENVQVDTSSFAERPVNILDFKQQNIPRQSLQYNHLMATFEYISYPDILATLKEERIFFPWINYSLQLAILQTFGSLSFLMVIPTHVRHFKNGRSDPTYSITENSNKLLNAILNNEDEGIILNRFVIALEEHRRMVKNTKLGKGIGPHVAQIRQNLNGKSNKLKYFLEKFASPQIYLTGFEQIEEIECGVGNVYSSDQIAVSFISKKDRFMFVMSSVGIFAEKLEKLKENFQTSLHVMLKIASRIAIASQMGALHLFKSTNPFIRKPEKKFSIAIHGGAGETILLQQDVIEVVNFALQTALTVGIEILDKGKSSLDAVEAAVMALENCFLFNAGRGAVYNHEGTHELEASIMDGKSQLSGSVACLTDIKNPIKAARIVMENSPHALISGTFVKPTFVENNIFPVKNNYFDTDIRLKHLMMIKSNQQGCSLNHPQTVGAVAIDQDGNLAAASSTGGIINKLKGRIGDTAIIGAGLYADNNIAIACTGDGEAFLRRSIASKIATLCKYMNLPLSEACHLIFQEELKNSYGGVIGIDSQGNVTIEQNSKVMFTALYDGEKLQVNMNTKNDNDLREWNIFENEDIVAYLHIFPCTPGVTIVEIKNKCVSDVFSLSVQEFVKIMVNIKYVSNILCDGLGVQRCALIVEPQNEKSAKILLIPLHGISDVWKPCVCSELEFHHSYPGYCSSKNGPKASDDDLNEIQNKIRRKLACQDLCYNFHGSANDDNLFAKIVKGEEKAQWRVWEDEDHVAFLTPFPNSYGFTVLVPRKHLDSNVFFLENDDYQKLMVASHKVSNLLKDALGASSCAMIFEGLEIDYAHVKLIPMLDVKNIKKKSKIIDFQDKYMGYVSSLNGPKANIDDLNIIRHKIISIKAPTSWKTPEQHSITAITHPWYSSIFKLQNTLYHSTVEFFHKINHYAYVMVPLTTDTISSPMGIGSDSEPVRVNLMDQDVYLADSMQFCLEYFLRLQEDLPGTYYVSPSFRGENPDNSHLNQFYHVECEMRGDMDIAIKIAEQYIYYLSKQMIRQNKEIILKLAGTTVHIEKMLNRFENSKRFPRITLDEALEMMPSSNCFELIEESRPELGKKLTREGEQFLIEKFHGPVWLTEMNHLSVPFYQAYVEGSELVKAKAADLLIGMGETLGLGERHETAKEVKDALAHHQVPEESYDWYINMRRVKSIKTSGWGMGTERYLCWLLNHNDVRDMHIIPRLKNKKFLP